MAAARNDVIDAFRGLSVAGVMAFHYTVACTPPLSGDLCLHTSRYQPDLAIGAHGVELFFVISGLVISMTVLRSSGPGEFGVRRFARLFPAFIVAATITFVLIRLFGPREFKVGLVDFAFNLTMMPKLFGRAYVDDVYWSLTPEIFFYVWVGLSFLVLKSRFWLGIVALALVEPAIHWSGIELLKKIAVSDHLGLFLIGMSIYFWIIEKRFKPAAICAATGVSLYAFVQVITGQLSPQNLAADGILSAAVCLLFLLMAFAPGLHAGPLAALGRISYSLYLVHDRLGITLIRHLHQAGASDAVAIGAAVAAAILLSVAIYRIVELPGQKLVLRLILGTRRAVPHQALR